MKNNEDGLGAIEVLLFVVIVGMIGFVSWYVYSAKKNTDKTLSSASSDSSVPTTTKKTTSSPPTTDVNAGYLVIKEWGVRIKPAVSMPSVTYVIDSATDIQPAQWAKLTFKDLPAECSGFYHFNRAKSGQDIDGYGNSPEKLLSKDSSSVKIVGDYYFILTHGQGGCSTDNTVTDKQNTLIEQFTGPSINSNGFTIVATPSS